MKGMIKEWNTKVFKNVFKQKQDVLEKLEKVNSIIIQKGLSLKLYHEQKYLKEEWEEIFSREEIYWRQKSHELWLRYGDKNKTYS